MPIYEYKCLECGARIEKMRKISDAPLTVCENCGGKLEKQVSRSGFQLKGEGWYVTDYSNKGKAETKTETKGETANSSESSGSSESSEKNSGNNPEKSSTVESTAKPDSASKPTETKTASKQ